jgi:hypothetical protein
VSALEDLIPPRYQLGGFNSSKVSAWATHVYLAIKKLGSLMSLNYAEKRKKHVPKIG